jgi:hypothetical protein
LGGAQNVLQRDSLDGPASSCICLLLLLLLLVSVRHMLLLRPYRTRLQAAQPRWLLRLLQLLPLLLSSCRHELRLLPPGRCSPVLLHWLLHDSSSARASYRQRQLLLQHAESSARQGHRWHRRSARLLLLQGQGPPGECSCPAGCVRRHRRSPGEGQGTLAWHLQRRHA